MILESTLRDHYEISFVDNGEEALAALLNDKFDLAIIDIVLPDMSGLQICNYIKGQEKLSELPVILLTSKESIDDKIKGFDSGADDYITKPFNYRELEARIKNQLRTERKQSNVLSVFDLEVDQDRQRVFSLKDRKEIELTRIEYKLLVCFGQRVDHVLSRQQILNLVWPNDLNISERTVDSHISNLRKKILVLVR